MCIGSCCMRKACIDFPMVHEQRKECIHPSDAGDLHAHAITSSVPQCNGMLPAMRARHVSSSLILAVASPGLVHIVACAFRSHRNSATCVHLSPPSSQQFHPTLTCTRCLVERPVCGRGSAHFASWEQQTPPVFDDKFAF